MACNDNYIMVRAACSPTDTPSTGLYIDDLPGITLGKAAHTTEDFAKGADLLDRCVEQGIIKVRNKLVSKLLGQVLFNQTLSTGRYGKFTDDIDTASNYITTTGASGLKLRLDNCSRLSQVQVKSVRVLLNESAAQTLTITDGVSTSTYSFTSVAMTPIDVMVNFNVNSEELRITLPSGKVVNNSTLNYSGSCGFCTNDCTGACNNSGLELWGWDGTNTSGFSYGLSATIHVICSQDKFFCEVNQFEPIAQAVWYASGVVFLDHLISTNRINVYTNYKKEDAKEIREDWKLEVDEHIDLIADKLPKYLMQLGIGGCIECNSSHWQHQIP